MPGGGRLTRVASALKSHEDAGEREGTNRFACSARGASACPAGGSTRLCAPSAQPCTSQAADSSNRVPVLSQSEGWEAEVQATPRWPTRTLNWCVPQPVGILPCKRRPGHGSHLPVQEEVGGESF